MAAIKNRITLEAIDGGVRFTFENCDHYLQNGTIDVPLNSLSLIFDESDMATFRKAASNDIFISAPITYFYGLDTKEDLADFYMENMVGGSGGGGSLEYYSEEEGQALIEVPSNIDGTNGVDVFNNGVNIYANEEQVGETSLYVSPTGVTINGEDVVTESWLEDYATVEALSDKADTSAVTVAIDAVNASLSGKADASAVPSVIVTDTSVEYYSDGSHTNTEILVTKNNGTPTEIKFPRINGQYLAGNTNDIDVLPTSAFTAYSAATNTALSGKADTSAVTAIADSLSGKQDTLLFYTEEDNTQDGSKDGRIETVIEDTENGVIKTAYVESYVNNLGQIATLNAHTEVNNSEESYQKSAEVYVEDGGVYLNYQTQDDNEQTNYNAQLDINADGIALSVDNGEDAVSFNVKTDGVDIDGDAVVTESMLDDYATAQDLEDTEEVLAQSINVLSDSLSGKQDTLIAGSGITISGNVISADGGGGGGMSEDDELLLATALVDLNDRKQDVLTAGSGITIDSGNVISCTVQGGTITIDPTLDSGSTNPVSNSAITNALTDSLGGLKLRALTQAQYEAISGSADPSTIYFITNVVS